MSKSEQKVVQYLGEAHASEVGLVSVLRSQIAMTPRGSYRDGLEKHLGETQEHARRIQERLGELGQGRNPVQVFVGFAETLISQSVALSKTPFDLLRGSGGEEKVLKNAKDACATEALEIATYTALERLATRVGDEQTAKLAASIRGDEERMLERIMREIPKLTDAVVGADVEGQAVLRHHQDRHGRRSPRQRTRSSNRHARHRRVPSAPLGRHARSPASRRSRDRSRAQSRPRRISRSRAMTRSPPRRSSASYPSSRRSTSPRSTPTSARTTTAPRC